MFQGPTKLLKIVRKSEEGESRFYFMLPALLRTYLDRFHGVVEGPGEFRGRRMRENGTDDPGGSSPPNALEHSLEIAPPRFVWGGGEVNKPI